MNNAIVTYVYPKSERFIKNFVTHINKLFTADLVLLIFNDGLMSCEQYFKDLNILYKIIPIKGNINEIRYNSFQYLTSNFKKTNNFIFQDIDDLFSLNRFDIIIEKLKKHPIVCNDLSAKNESGIIKKSTWGNRLKNDFKFDAQFIENKNILGLGNVGVRYEVLTIPTVLSDQPLAFDWFYFYQILKSAKLKAIFTTECVTEYFQYDENIAGINKGISIDNITKIIRVKQKHYETLINIGYPELLPILEKTNNINNINLQKIDPNQNYFWWEETENL